MSSVLSRAFLHYRSSYTDKAFAATTPEADEIRQRMAEGPILVAINDGEIIGTVAVVEKNDGLYIRGMAVLPTARGQRIGELLLQEIERHARERRLGRLFLSTTPFLARAIRLYENYGFTRTAEGPHALFGTPLFTMEKLLE